MNTAELSARITLRAIGLTDRALNSLIDEYGSGTDALRAPQLLQPDIKSQADKSVRARVLYAMRTIDRLDIRVIAADAPDYPRRVADRLGDARPALLFALGDVGIIDNAAVAIVGARQMSEYGRTVADDFARILARAGYTILSGLALGVDTVAHESALFEESDTIAIVGNGIDIVYPPSNGPLRQRIIQNGLLLSQFLPGQRPLPYNFPQRNLTMAALSEGVLVVEAGPRSGAIITAHHAAECGVEAMAIPGPIGRVQSLGTNQLIREGAACVTTPAEVMEMLDEPGRVAALMRQRSSAREKRHAASGRDSGTEKIAWINEETRAVRNALDTCVLHLDEIVERTGIGVSAVVTALLELEMNGHVRQHPGSRYELR
jgi:DNA processing protein